MKQIKLNVSTILNRAMAAAMALLGFSACDESDAVCMYGSPHATFEVSGRVEDASGKTLEGAKIFGKGKLGNGEFGLMTDTVVTDEDGKYILTGGLVDEVRVVCLPPSKEMEADSAEVKLAYKGGDGSWNLGHADAEVNFTIKNKEQSPLD